MANGEHLKILKQGVDAWNRWRDENRDIRPDLSEADLSGANLRQANLISVDFAKADLSGADLSRADLGWADLCEANLCEAKLMRADLREADLTWANLCEANLARANLGWASLSPAELMQANLCEADLTWANLCEANLSEADLSEADLGWANLCEADLIRANLSGAILTEANLSHANLSWANLSMAYLIRVNLRQANLSGADLSGANLRMAYLSDANLSGANLSGANLSRTDLIRTDLSGANLTEARVGLTTFGNLDLSAVKGLDAVIHFGPSTISIDTIHRSTGNIPEIFLQGAGVPDTFIEYTVSLVGKPIEFYSCFISYSSKDCEFAERLHNDLQGEGVRCWFAPEDMKIGDRIRPSINQAIRLYDKLLIVLSEHSIDSDWVEKEVETAFEEERRRKTTILFPIRLDSTVMDTDQAWAADIRRTRHIGDFSHWKDDDAYQKAFERLLRDLKAAEVVEAATRPRED